jgi:hypothetical protein
MRRALGSLVFLAGFALAASPASASQGAPPPAGGAELGQIIIATAAAMVVTVALLYFGFGHRSGRVTTLERCAAWAERRSGMPGWTVLPAALATISLVVALFGMYWDISLHIDNGRDPGPLANPAHYFILTGLFGIFTAGFIAMVLPRERPSTVAIRLGRDWWAPLGGVLICACGAFSLIGFPLDDVWHRLFGQDVTLWGPTHLMLIGGAAMTLVGIAVLTVEGLRANVANGATQAEPLLTKGMRAVALTGGLMVGLSTFQAEFDFGVPQFQLIFQPMLLMLAAGVGLVFARIYGGRGSALGAVAFFLVLRGGLALAIGPVLGQTMPHFPLYIAEALVVEAIALRVATSSPLRFGLWSGLGIGTVGLAAEWAWSQLWMPLPWGPALFPEAAVVGFAAAMAGAMIGAWIGARVSVEPGVSRPRLRTAAVCAAAVLSALVVFGLYTSPDRGVSARVVLTDVAGSAGREAQASIALRPADAAKGADWFDVTAWQGGGLVVDRLEQVGPGRYRTTEPIPIHGDWKTMIRWENGNSLTALPIYFPRDAAIPVGGIPAKASFTRSFRNEHKLLQREQTGGSPLVVALAYSVVAGIALALLALLAWALHRLSFGPAERRSKVRRPRPVGVGGEAGVSR